MGILLNKDSDLYIGGRGFQASIFMMLIEKRLLEQGRDSETRPEGAFEDALADGVQTVIITDEGLVEGTVILKYENGEEVTALEKEVEMFAVNELKGKIILFCEEEEDDSEDFEEFDD